MKKFLALLLTLVLVLSLCGCSVLDKLKRPATKAPTEPTIPQETQMVPANDVDFELSEPADPGFGSVDGTPVESHIEMPSEEMPADFTDPSDNSVVTDDTMYTLVGDYAYALDPNTFEPVGEPLDPVTHEPISSIQNDAPPVPGSATDGIETITIPPEPADTPTIPPEEKLPNTGEFLEDDD